MNKKIFKLAIKKKYDPESREITGWAYRSDEIDRDNELILASAWQDPNSTKNFFRNPVLMPMHQYSSLPLGRVRELEPSEKGLWFRANFATTAAAREAAQFIEDTELAAFSVGFIPLEKPKEISVKQLRRMGIDVGHRADGKMIPCYAKIELLEISLTGVPSSPGSTALGAAYAGGLIKSKALKSALDQWITVEDDKPDGVPAHMYRAMEKAAEQTFTQEKIADLITVSLEGLREKVKDAGEELEIIVEEDEEYITKEQMGVMVRKACDRVLTPETLKKMLEDAISLAVDKARGVVR